jgi:DNA-binding transcriptional ArsR family regulator
MRLGATEAEHVAEVMSGLATPARVLILARLLSSPATVTELSEELDLSQTTASNHLRILRHLNLVNGDRQGRNVVYQLQDDHVRSMIEQILSHASHD